MITIREIADLAGVSRGTVDRVLNGRGGVRGSVVERINHIVSQYGYKPNKAARTLAIHKKASLIGVISPSLDNMFFKEVLRGIHAGEKDVEDIGVSIMYREIPQFSVKEQLHFLREMKKAGVDGLAVNPINHPDIVEVLRTFNQDGIPILTFNTDIVGIDRLAYIGCDYEKNGRIAAGLVNLVSQGKATVAVVIGSFASLGHGLRLEGFRSAAAAHPGISIGAVVEMYDDEITSYCKVRDLLKRDSAIDAFFFAAGGKEGGMRAIAESGRGGAVKIITVDLDPLTVACLESGMVSATICQQPYVQGYEAVRQLAAYVVYDESPAEPIQYTRSEIILRESIAEPTPQVNSA